MNTWNIRTSAPNAHRLEFTGIKSGWKGRMLLMSDEHVDNLHCDRKLLTRHHEEATAVNAPICKFGDTFDAMQGKWDKRADQNALREEHRGNMYLDKLVQTTAEYFTPYAKNIALITPGNHEASIELRHQTSLLDRLIERVATKSTHRIAKGAYAGFLKIGFRKAGGGRGAGCPIQSFDLRWHHGYGGGGEVTRGLIDNNRTRGQAHADIYYSGHIHRRNCDENIVTALNGQMRVEDRPQWFLRGSAYKDEHSDGNGWHVAQGREARPKGGWWLEFAYLNNKITVTPIPAL